MPILHATNIACQFDGGDTLFSDLSLSLVHRQVGLIGRNGVGKSILASILAGSMEPSEGSVSLNGSVATYSQLPSQLLSSPLTIAQYLEVDDVIEALDRIELGSVESRWYDIVGERWQLKAELFELLRSLGLPDQLHHPCRQLSGGQLSRLLLWKLFHSDAELLILDEPSNHMDLSGKQWLLEQIDSFEGYLILISHDRLLLRHMEHIWELSTLGLRQYGGNYDFYTEQKAIEVSAIEKQLNDARREKKHIQRQAQTDRERADQRARQGNRIREQGSQPKMLLDAKKDSATARAANRKTNVQKRQKLLQEKTSDLVQRHESLKPQKLYLQTDAGPRKAVVTLDHCVLPFGSAHPINLEVSSASKIHLEGNNGCGKSTLFRVLLGDIEPLHGQVRVNGPVFFLDQHFSLLHASLSMLENMLQLCAGLAELDARTLLAGIGFRREEVFRRAEQLSGGESMKLAMLIVSHQNKQPLLLLDEPDNHLDLESRQVLADALKPYPGGFMLISHDPDFVSASGVTEVYQFQPDPAATQTERDPDT